MRPKYIIPILTLVAGAPALARSDIDPAHKNAWSENIGWTNWHDAGSPPGVQGVQVNATFLSGMIWAENVGWINLGDGSPGDGIEYANMDGTDFGVNRDQATGELFGLAWGENIGWINFAGGALATPSNPARIENTGGVCRLAGFFWGENIGWINLNDATHFVAVFGGCESPCDLAADLDHDDDVDLQDLALLLAHFGTSSGATFEDGDTDGDGDVDLQDLANLLSLFGTTCP